MLLDDWSEQELELARAIGGGRTSLPLRPGDAHAPVDVLDELQDEDMFGTAIDTPNGASLDHDTDHGTDHGSNAAAYPGVGEAPEASIALDLKPCGGDGVILLLQIDGQRAKAWADAQAWCDWLAPRLAVQKLQHIPPDLVGLLGQWALLPLVPHVERAGLGLPRFTGMEPGSCARAIAPTLTLRRDDAELDLRLVEWPEPWISALAQTMEDKRPRLSIPPIPVALAAGWARLTRAQLLALEPGDGIVLDHAVAVERGHAWLTAERPLARVRFDDGAWCVERIYQEEHSMEHNADATLRTAELGDDSIVLTAVAEVGRLSMSLDTLRDLQAGQVLELTHAAHGRITLTVSGQAVASGTLLRVGDKLVMRIE